MTNGRVLTVATVVAMTILVSGCATSSTSTGSPEPSTSTTGAVPSAEPTPGASPTGPATSASVGGAPSIGWEEQEFDELAGPVMADGDWFVVAGSGTEGRSAWTSTDGLSWERHAVPDPIEADCTPSEPVCLVRSAQMGPMVRLGDTLYSFGATQFFNDYIRAVGWRWTDGQPWQEIQSESPIFSGGFFKAAAATDESIFAVTHQGYELTERHWLWRPDTSWQRVGEEISVDNPIEFRSVAWRQGRLLAVGATLDLDAATDDRRSDPSVWSSIDGSTWLAGSTPNGASAFCTVSATDDGFFATGLDGDGHPVVWRTEDGSDWSAAALPTELSVDTGGPDFAMNGCQGKVVELPAGFLAFLPVGDTTLTWTSDDGMTWVEGPPLDIRTGSTSFAAIDDTIVAFGQRGPMGAPDTMQALFVGTVGPPED